MAIASMIEVMDALADQIDAAVNTTALKVQVGSRRINSPSPPTIDLVFPADPPTDPDLAGFYDAQGADLLNVRARVATNDDDSNQDILVEFCDQFSSLSVAAAILDDPLLGGLARLDIVGSTGLRQYTVDPDAIIGAEWTVRVIRMES